ncbi:MAG: arsenosugar biosynthesis radical SAM protein ArsS [Acidobacteria bacterium]|nr:arsenosugar biosynthesis radical SAM protein ArsS [Acidobacteriota bacterium]
MDKTDSFMDRLKGSAAYPLRAQSIEILQLNVTRRCNLCCRHCHVEGSPEQTGELSRENMEACLRVAAIPEITTLDITGGAPEMHPRLEWFLKEAAGIGKRLLVRSNGAILLEDPYRRYLDIYAETGVEVVLSLPHPLRERTDRMRGTGIFERIITAMKELNKRGYGNSETGRILNLVHNPVGAFLPGSQQALESEYRSRLRQDYGVEFNSLYCLTNCPVGRYLDFLKRSGNLPDYINLLKQSFNPEAVQNLMCRTTLSVGVDGRLFDCDFNQVLDLSLSDGTPAHIRDFNYEKLSRREIVVRSHCFACTAGSGSSCQGALE